MSQQSPPVSVCFPCFLLRANYLGSLQLGSLNSFGNATVLAVSWPEPHRTWPPVELPMLHWLQSLSSSNMPNLLVQPHRTLPPVELRMLQIFLGNATVLVQPHQTLPPVELRMLHWLQSLSSSTGHCRPLGFGFFIASICLDRFFTKTASVDLWSLSSSKMPSLLTALPSQCCPTFFLPCSADLG